MKRLIKLLAMLLLLAIVVVSFSGCTEAQKVSASISKQADEFHIVRRVSVINMRTDTIVMQVIGTLSVIKSDDGDVDLMIRTSEETYKKNFLNLNDWTIYTVDDVTGEYPLYYFEIKYNPNLLRPFGAEGVYGTSEDEGSK